jgi:hypothetical protein
MEELLRDGRLVHTRSGMPRLKRYLDDTRDRVSPFWAHQGKSTKQLLQDVLSYASNCGGENLPVLGLGCTDADCVLAAHACQVSWVAVAPSHRFGAMIRSQIFTTLGNGIRYAFEQRESAAAAQELAEADPEEFRYWALESMGATFNPTLRSSQPAVDGYVWTDHASPIPIIVISKQRDAQDLDVLRRRLRAARVAHALVVVARPIPRSSPLPSNVRLVTIKDVVTGKWYGNLSDIVAPRPIKARHDASRLNRAVPTAERR